MFFFRFSSLDKQDKGFLSREDFLRIPELAINPLGDRIVHAFFQESKVCCVSAYIVDLKRSFITFEIIFLFKFIIF